MQDHPPSPDLPAREEMTTREAATYLRCSEGYLINLRGLGGGPPFQRRWVRKGIYYLRDDLDVWKRGRRYLATTDYEDDKYAE